MKTIYVKDKGYKGFKEKVSVHKFYDKITFKKFDFYPIGRNLFDKYLHKSQDFVYCDICGCGYEWHNFWVFMEYAPEFSKLVCKITCKDKKI